MAHFTLLWAALSWHRIKYCSQELLFAVIWSLEIFNRCLGSTFAKRPVNFQMDKITWTTSLAASRRDLVMRWLIRFWKEPQITGIWEKVNTAGSQSSIYAVSSQLEEGFSCNDITGIISGKPYRPELIRGKRKQNTFALTINYEPRECPGY